MPLAECAKARNSIFPTLACESLEKGRTQQLACQWETRKAALYFKGFSLGRSAPLVNQGDLERGRRETWREREEEAFLLVSRSRMETHNGLHWANQGPFSLLHYVREFRAGSFPNLQLKHTCGPATLGAHTGLHKAAIQSVHEAWRCVLLLFWLPLSWPDSISTWKARLPR